MSPCKTCKVLGACPKKTTSSFYPYLGVDITATSDNFTYQEYLMYEPSRKLPLSVFDAQPVQGKRIMNATLEQHSESEISVVFHGCTWSFRTAFEIARLTTARYEENGAIKYVHVLANVNVSKEEDIAKVDIVFQNVLKCLVCRVLESRTLKGDKTKAFIERLSDMHEQLHFV